MSSRWRALVAGILIISAGLLAYCNSFRGPFIFDDVGSIVENGSIRGLWPIWSALGGSARAGITVAGRPVLNLSLAVNYQISGLEVWSYHLVNLGIHILAGLVLFGVIRRTLLSKGLQERFGRASWCLALICALIWLVHPLQTGSVTYIVQRAESLMGLFYLLSLYWAIRGFGADKSGWWYVGAIGACAFGVGSKEVAATVPLMILLYDRIFISRSFKEMLARRWGLYVGLAGTWAIFGVLSWTAPRGTSVGFHDPNFTAWVYGMTQCKVIVLYYLRLSFWPSELVLDYGWPISKTIWEVWYYAVVVLGLLMGTVVAICKWPRFGFLGVWFFVILGPSSSFVPILTEVAAEHRMYLPLAAVVVAVVVFGYAIGGRILSRFGISDGRRRVVGYGLAGIVIVVLGLVTIERNAVYGSELSIWADVVAKQGGNWRAWYSRGAAYGKKGKDREAVGDYTRAIKLNSQYSEAYNNRGRLYGLQRRDELAMADFNQAIRYDREYAKAYNNRGSLYGMRGRYDLAIGDFTRAIDLNPNFMEAYKNRGIAYRSKGEHGLANRDFSRARELIRRGH